MNDQRSFERFVADNVAGHSQGISLPDDFYDDMHSFATTTRQRPEWLALIKEPPMRTNSRVAVGSPTARVIGVMAATLLLIAAMTAAGIGIQRLLAADSSIIVDQSGNGDYTTLAEAVAAATDGDEILIRPGTYTEAVVIDKDLTIRGDGPREDIVIGGYQEPERWAAGSDCETSTPGACAIVLSETTTTLSDITLRGSHSGLKIMGGAPTVTGVALDHVGAPDTDGEDAGGLAMLIDAGSAARILGNEFLATAELMIDGGAVPLIEGNSLREGSRIVADVAGDETVIRANEITDAAGVAIKLNAATKLLIEDNVVTASVDDGIQLSPFGSDGVEPVIRGNTISASGGSAVNGIVGGTPTIESNTFVDNEFGVLLGLGQAVIRGNDIRGDGSGITVTRGSDPTISDNTIDVVGVGVNLVEGARGTLSHNDVCGGVASISVHENAETLVDDSNEAC